MSSTKNTADDRPFDPLVFWVSASLTVLFILWSILLPQSMERVVDAVFNWTTQGWGWLYLLTAFALVAACLVLMLTRYGDMKLGLPGDEPEFSTLSWFAMLFGSAIAAGIVFWGPAEPAPPFYGGTAFPLMFLLLTLLYGTFRGLQQHRSQHSSG
jgi:choline/glycine/proline betaine transport protein/glycine betaine transporter